MKKFAKRLVSAYRRHGPASFAALVLRNIGYLTLKLGRRTPQERSNFDQVLGVETDLIREVGSLDIGSHINARYAVRYQPSPVDPVRKALSDLPINHGRYTFIDFGAGKGRVLILASEYPFHAVVGVEFSRELVDAAEQNIRRLPDGMKKALDVRCVYRDIAEFEVPPNPLVCYFYNPCSAEILARVISRLEKSWMSEPRDILAIYLDPRHRQLFEESGRWARVGTTNLYTVYRLSSDPRAQ